MRVHQHLVVSALALAGSFTLGSVSRASGNRANTERRMASAVRKVPNTNSLFEVRHSHGKCDCQSSRDLSGRQAVLRAVVYGRPSRLRQAG